MPFNKLRWPIIVIMLIECGFVPQGWPMAKQPPPIAPETKVAAAPLPILTLSECYHLTLKQSETLAIRKVEIDKTWADFLKATGTALGDIDFVMNNFQQQTPSGGSSSGGATGTLTMPERQTNTFTINQPLFQGFKSFGALAAVGSIKTGRVDEYIRAKQLLFRDVATAYFSVLRYEEDYRITEELKVLLTERVNELIAREKIGRSRPSEIANAEAGLRVADSRLAATKGYIAVQRRVLEFLTGIPVMDRKLDIHQPKVLAPDALTSYLPAAEYRPDVEARQAQAKTQLQNIVIAQSALWPDLSFASNFYEKRQGVQSGIDWDITFVFDVPLFRGGTTLGQIKQAYSDWKQSKLLHTHTKRTAELEIKRSYEVLIAALATHHSLEAAVNAAERNYRLQKEDYAHNLVSNLDVLQSLETLHNSRMSLNQALYELRTSYWDLRVATGDCCESI